MNEPKEPDRGIDPVDGVDPNEAPLEELSRAARAWRLAGVQDDAGNDEAADDEKDVDADDAEGRQASRAVLPKLLERVSPSDLSDGDGAEDLHAIDLLDWRW